MPPYISAQSDSTLSRNVRTVYMLIVTPNDLYIAGQSVISSMTQKAHERVHPCTCHVIR